MAEIYQLPENGNNNGWGLPISIPIGNMGWNNGYGNGMFGGSGFWGAGIGGFLGSALGNLIGGNGLGMNGNAAAAASLGAQATANNNTDLIMQAINGTDSDVRLLATTLNADVNEVRSDLNTINLAAQQVGANVGLTGQQVINSIVQGNMNLAQQLCQCCCEMKQLVTSQGYENQIATLNQTNQLGAAINGNGQRTIDAIADLKTTMVKEFCDVKEREMQDKINTQAEIITQLRNAADNANQTNQIIGYVNSVVSPLQRTVDKIRENQPETVNVPYPQLTAVNTTPYVSGGVYPNGFFGNGWGNGFFSNGFGGF